MPSNKKPVTHLTLLNNHFLNCLFNNPQYNKYPFKQTVLILKTNHNDYTILVPSAEILNERFDGAPGRISNAKLLKSLCYDSEDFIQSHIIKMIDRNLQTEPSRERYPLQVFGTLNGKQVLLKNGEIYTGKGFKRSLKVRILKVDVFYSFCDYFPKGSQFQIIYIDNVLYGSYDYNGNIKNLIISEEKPPNLRHQKMPENSITFEKLLRSFPALSRMMSDKFYTLFHHNNHQFGTLSTSTRKKVSSISSDFHAILHEAFKIVQESLSEDTNASNEGLRIMKQILQTYADLDFNRLVHEYVELYLYDRIWSQIAFQFDRSVSDIDRKTVYDTEAIKVMTPERYSEFRFISLNQLDVPHIDPWEYNELCKRIKKASNELAKLNEPSVLPLSEKVIILINCVKFLTAGEEDSQAQSNLVINADVLIGLLIMVVVNSKVDNIEVHLYYVKNFSYTNFAEDGYVSYILSNFDAVLLHLSTNIHSDRKDNLATLSSENQKFLHALEDESGLKIKEILESIESRTGDQDVPFSCVLRYRDIDGEDCLMRAIKLRNYKVVDILLNFKTSWFSIEDILFSVNTTNGQNLLMMSLIEQDHDISELLIDIICSNTTLEEQKAYFNSTDALGKTIGHYLYHDFGLIYKIGHLVNWELKDLNTHTPLFSLCRCYDHPKYHDLIRTAFDFIYEAFGENYINFDRHIDRAGNGLLHIIPRFLESTQLLTRRKNIIDVNQLNKKLLTPLDVYVKYNRPENIEQILKDDRLDVMCEDNTNHITAFDYLVSLRAKSSSGSFYERLQKCILSYCFERFFPRSGKERTFVMSARLEGPKDLALYLANGMHPEGLSSETLERVRQFIHIFKISNTYSIFPSPESFFLNFAHLDRVPPLFKKLNLNRLVDALNVFIICLNMHPGFSEKAVLLEFFSKCQGKLLPELIKLYSPDKWNDLRGVKTVILKEGLIEEMDFFLEYSSEDLRKYDRIICKLNKLTMFSDMKNADLSYVTSSLQKRAFGLLHIDPGAYNTVTSEHDDDDNGYRELVKYFIWLEKCNLELILNINKLRDALATFRTAYDEMNEISVNLDKLQYSSVRDGELRSSPLANAQDTNDTTAKSTRLDSSDILSLFNFSTFVDNRKSKVKRLLDARVEKEEFLKRLSIEIKEDYSILATEISNFLTFKSSLTKLGIKNYVQRELYCLRRRFYKLNKQFHHISSV